MNSHSLVVLYKSLNSLLVHNKSLNFSSGFFFFLKSLNILVVLENSLNPLVVLGKSLNFS